MNWIDSKTIWGAIKRAVRDIEHDNKIKFGNEAWQRMKKLEEELIAYEREAVQNALNLHGLGTETYDNDDGMTPFNAAWDD